MDHDDSKPTREQRLDALENIQVELVLVGGKAIAMIGRATVKMQEPAAIVIPDSLPHSAKTDKRYCAAALCAADDGFRVATGLRMLRKRLSLRMRNEEQDSQLVWVTPKGRAPIDTFQTLLMTIYGNDLDNQLRGWLSPTQLRLIQPLGNVTHHAVLGGMPKPPSLEQ